MIFCKNSTFPFFVVHWGVKSFGFHLILSSNYFHDQNYCYWCCWTIILVGNFWNLPILVRKLEVLVRLVEAEKPVRLPLLLQFLKKKKIILFVKKNKHNSIISYRLHLIAMMQYRYSR